MPISQFLVVIFVLELTPGPNMAYLATLALSRGWAAGLMATAGVAVGLSTHAILASLGAGALIERSPLAYEVLRWGGVAYLLWLAAEGWRGEKETSPGTTAPGAGTGLFWRGVLSNVLNPKSILFFVTVVPRFVVADAGSPMAVQLAIYGTLYVAVATAVHATIVLLAARLRPWLVAGPRRDVTRRVLSVALAGVAAWLAWTTRR